jgi:hypothetical protein
MFPSSSAEICRNLTLPSRRGDNGIQDDGDRHPNEKGDEGEECDTPNGEGSGNPLQHRKTCSIINFFFFRMPGRQINSFSYSRNTIKSVFL